MPPQFVYTMQDVCKAYGDKTVLDGISLSFFYGAKIGIVGDNGAGKSTLMKIMAGLDDEYHGIASLTKGMRVGYVPQEPHLDPNKTVRGNIEDGMAIQKNLVARYDEISDKLYGDADESDQQKLMDELGKVQDEIDRLDAWDVDYQLDIAADALVLPPDDADVTTLSGGERRRVALCKVLLEKPDLLLLDEPTNHLDAETVAWLEMTLRDYHGTVIIITHDRYFLDNITKWILEIEETKGLPFEGNYSSWLEQKIAILRRIEKRESQRQRILQRELDWINSSAADRHEAAEARMQGYEKRADQKFELSREDFAIQIAPGPRLGQKVLVINELSKCYGDQVLLNKINVEIPRGAIVGIIGPNGTGKTTFFRMLVGEEQPDSGAIEFGETVLLSYVDQHRDALQDNITVYDEVTDGEEEISLGDRTINGRAYLSRFNLRGSTQNKKVGDLSGGERNRVHLAKLLRKGGNLLLLDEPTNDLDVNTLRVLEQGLIDFPGCALIISHDRYFLDRVCTHLLLFEGEGQVRLFHGTFQEYEKKILQANDNERLLHRRGKYKKLRLK